MSAMTMAPTGQVLRGARVEARRASTRPRVDVVPGEPRVGSGGPMHLTWRGRVVVALLALALLAGAFVLGTRAAADEAVGSGYVEHVVAPGETLWQIAAGVRADGESTQDAVDALVRLNGLSGPQVMAGETLKVPGA
ncbi:LysM peptidoglycan-binding domain-containing protein [Cellulomonas composti]|uniref:LysM domain-containing protein n=1 Tax=Cellulomonas composti TaxID=266130 RepID=A0A511J8E1_9CELL|nr:LysM peptidoglycan-binding domain-containing protein [Cellulomonas composti]GEL94267.1 hypothetical protein CCO02nite_09250 [Cellulomonas composti]